MKKIISLILVSIIGISIIPKTLVNEKHEVLESSISVYTKEEADSMLTALNNNITVNTNEIISLKNEITALNDSLTNYALKSDLSTTNSNIDDLNTIVANNTNRIEALENKSLSLEKIGSFSGTSPSMGSGQPFSAIYSNSTISANMPSLSVDDYIIVITQVISSSSDNNYNTSGGGDSATLNPQITNLTSTSMTISNTGVTYGRNSGSGYRIGSVRISGDIYYLGT